MIIGFTSSSGPETTGDSVSVSSFYTPEGLFEPGLFEPGLFEEGTFPHVLFDSTIDVGVLGQVMPSRYGNRYTRVGWKVYVDEEEYNPLLAPNVTRSIDRNIQTGFLQALAYGNSKLGPIINATPTGKKPVTIAQFFRNEDGELFEEPLLTNSVCLDAERVSGSIPVDSLGLQDQNGVVALKRVSHQEVAGSNKNRATVISSLLQAAGVQTSEIAFPSDMGVMNKPLDIDKGPAIDLSQALAEVSGYRLIRDRNNVFTVAPYRPELGFSKIDWVYGPGDWIDSILGQEVNYSIRPTAIPTFKVHVTSSKQITSDRNCSQRTIRYRTDTYTTEFDPNHLPFRQVGSETFGDGIVANPFSGGIGGSRLIAISIHDKTYSCGIVKSEKITTYVYRNLLTARYDHTFTTDEVITSKPCYSDDDSPSSPGYKYSKDRFMKDTETYIAYDYYPGGELRSRVETGYRYKYISVASKTRTVFGPGSDPWEERPPFMDYSLDGSNGMRAPNNGYPTEQFIKTYIKSEVYDVNNGFVTKKVSEEQGYGLKPGRTALYGNSETYGQSSETFQLLERTTEEWNKQNENRFTKYTRKWLLNPPANFSAFVVENSTGSPPAASKGEFIDDGGELLSDSLDNQQMSVICTVESLGDDRFVQEIGPITLEWPESLFELQNMCRRMILIGAANRISFTAPPNPLLEPGHVIRFIGRDGVNEVGYLVEVNHQDIGVPITVVTMESYPTIQVSFS